jgi:hypothetical protein
VLETASKSEGTANRCTCVGVVVIVVLEENLPVRSYWLLGVVLILDFGELDHRGDWILRGPEDVFRADCVDRGFQ